ncbi:MAG: peptide deformylase [Hyphomicrobiales bacterium]|nr:peptide deformylase [Hyphomicrobiales bacterium]
MAILKIARMGHPVLRRPAEAVADPTAPQVRRLVEDMLDTLADAGGLGLAAPQVHVASRVVIFHVPEGRARAESPGTAAGEPDPEDGAVPLTVLVNPVIEPLGEDRNLAFEGCLSIPGMTGAVPRFSRIRYTGVTLEGETVDRTASGFHARVVQHECDHLDGILYPQRMDDLSTFGFVEEMRRPPPAAEAD